MKVSPYEFKRSTIFLWPLPASILYGSSKTTQKSANQSISYAIKRLEESFNCKLIHHDPSHRSFKLTPQGQILLKHTEKILSEVISTRKEINRSLAQYSTVGFPPIIIQYLFACLKRKKINSIFKKGKPYPRWLRRVIKSSPQGRPWCKPTRLDWTTQSSFNRDTWTLS